MKLVLVLLLILLPTGHLILHLPRSLVNLVLKDAATGLNAGHLAVELALHLQHLLGDDVLDVLLVEAFLFRGLLVVRIVREVVVRVLEQRLLHVDFELEALRHLLIELDDLREDRPSANVCQNLLLHFHCEP